MTGGLKMGVNVAAHTRHIFLGSAPPPPVSTHILLLMFTTTDCNCHNLTIVITLLSKPIVVSLKYLQDMNGLLIVFYMWLTEQDRECEWNQGPGGGWGSTRCLKRVVFHRWMIRCLPRLPFHSYPNTVTPSPALHQKISQPSLHWTTNIQGLFQILIYTKNIKRLEQFTRIQRHHRRSQAFQTANHQPSIINFSVAHTTRFVLLHQECWAV